METTQATQNVTDEKSIAEQTETKEEIIDAIVEELNGEDYNTAICAGLLVGLKLRRATKIVAENENGNDEKSIDQQTQDRIRQYYKNLDPKTKLAIVTMSDMLALDGLSFQSKVPHSNRIFNQIYTELEADCIEKYHTESDDVIAVAVGAIDKEDIWLAGVWEAVRMVLQNC